MSPLKNTFCFPNCPVISSHLLTKNTPMLTYSHLGFKKFAGENPPGTPVSERAASLREGRGNWGGEGKEGGRLPSRTTCQNTMRCPCHGFLLWHETASSLLLKNWNKPRHRRSSSTSALDVPSIRDCSQSATERFPSPRHEHGTVCHLKWRHQIPCKPSKPN